MVPLEPVHSGYSRKKARRYLRRIHMRYRIKGMAYKQADKGSGCPQRLCGKLRRGVKSGKKYGGDRAREKIEQYRKEGSRIGLGEQYTKGRRRPSSREHRSVSHLDTKESAELRITPLHHLPSRRSGAHSSKPKVGKHRTKPSRSASCSNTRKPPSAAEHRPYRPGEVPPTEIPVLKTG